MNPCLVSIATALPRASVDQERAARLVAAYMASGADQERALDVLFRRSGVKNRAGVLLKSPGKGDGPLLPFFPPAEGPGDRGPSTRRRMERFEAEAPVLALEAGRGALASAGVPAAKISHVVTVCCTGLYAPGPDIALLKGLSLPPETTRTHLGFMGCQGALNGLRVAASLACSGSPGPVLLCAVELCSLHLQYGWSPEQAVTQALFADGAGAAVVLPGEREGAAAWRIAAHGCALIPDSEDAMTWNVGDHGFRMTLSPRVPDLIACHLKEWLERWLAGHGVDIAGVGSWALHPGGPRILDAVGEALGLPRPATEDSREVLAAYGNMSSPTVLFILEKLLRRDAPRPCVALAFGPGLTVESVLLA